MFKPLKVLNTVYIHIMYSKMIRNALLIRYAGKEDNSTCRRKFYYIFCFSIGPFMNYTVDIDEATFYQFIDTLTSEIYVRI